MTSRARADVTGLRNPRRPAWLVAAVVAAFAPASWSQEAFRDCPHCPDMVSVGPGSFLMGSAGDDPERSSDGREEPQTATTVPYRFALARNEVTVGQFRRFVASTGYLTDAERDLKYAGCLAWAIEDRTMKWRPGLNWRNPGYPQDDRHPVVCVSWTDAQAFVRWVSQETGRTYRLPSEAEWEFAARAGSRETRPWGSDPKRACADANVADQTPGPDGYVWQELHECRDSYFFTAPVGTYRANALGFNDMIGNVWEWTRDCYQPDAYRSGKQGSSAPASPDCPARTLKGGSWLTGPGRARPAYRGGYDEAMRTNAFGFRLAREMP